MPSCHRHHEAGGGIAGIRRRIEAFEGTLLLTSPVGNIFANLGL